MNNKKICPIIKNLQAIVNIAQVIEKYILDPKSTIELEVNKIPYGTNVLEESRLRNLQKGLNSELTKDVAYSLGKKELLETLNSHILDIKMLFNFKLNKLKSYSNILKNFLTTVDENVNSGYIDTRLLAINSSELYKRTFIERLRRDFEPSLRGIQYRIDFDITLEKLLAIFKIYIDKLISKNSVGILTDINKTVKELLDLTKDLNTLEIVVPKDVLEEKELPDGQEDKYLVKVKIFNKEETGGLLKNLALEIPELDNINIEPLDAINSLKEPLFKYYDKANGDINVMTDVIDGSFKELIEDTLPRIEDAIGSITKEFLANHITNELLHERLTTYINTLIKIAQLEKYITSTFKDVIDASATDYSQFIAMFNIYTLILSNSIGISKTPKIER